MPLVTAVYGRGFYGQGVYGSTITFTGQTASYQTQISIFDPFWRNERRVAVGGLRASWAINAPGRLSCFIPAQPGVNPRSYRARWVLWEHPTCGVWGGFVEDLPDDSGAGTIEIGCVSMAGMLDLQVGPRIDAPARAQAGALALYAFRNAQTDGHIPFEEMSADEAGPDLEMEWRGESTLSTWQSLQSSSSQDWNVVTTRDRKIYPYWRKQYGRDLRGSVLLADGYQFATMRMDDSIATVVNDLFGSSELERYQARSVVEVEDADSLIALGQRRQKNVRYPGLVRKGSLRAAADYDLDKLSDPALSTTVVMPSDKTVGTISYPLTVREGDTVRLWRAGKPLPFDYRILGREIDTIAGTLTLSGTAKEVA
jgi:hypothetical protein